jgi:hypothetical protein
MIPIKLPKPVIKLEDAVGQRLEGARFDSSELTLVFEGGIVQIDCENDYDSASMKELSGEDEPHVHDLALLGVLSQDEVNAWYAAKRVEFEKQREAGMRRQYEELHAKFGKDPK